MSSNAPLILCIEDEKAIRRLLEISLQANGYRFLGASTGQEGLQKVAQHRPDIILLDLGLPDQDGLQIICSLREWTPIPILILSARDQERDKIEALDQGADDYLTKPFSQGELLARIRVAIRHQTSQEQKDRLPIHHIGLVTVDLQKRQVSLRGIDIHLTPIEYKILTFLLKYRGRVVTHKQLLKEIWGPYVLDRNHYLRVYMTQLRHKLEADSTRPEFLLTETGIGYRLKEE